MQASLKPLGITKGEKRRGFFSSRLCREEDSSLFNRLWRNRKASPKPKAITEGEKGRRFFLFSTLSRGGLVSIQSALPKPKVKRRMEGTCEARRIVDPSTMGSSLLSRLRRLRRGLVSSLSASKKPKATTATTATTKGASLAEAFGDWEEGSARRESDRRRR